MANARELALQTLTDILIDGAYSNHALSEQIEKNELTVQDKNFMTELVYGTLQHEQLLNFYVTPFFNGKVKAWVRILIQMTLYQMLFLDSVPEHAAISEAVKIAKKRGGQFNGKLVNAILREMTRTPLPSLDTIKDEAERLAVETSHPLWLIKLWSKQFGWEKTIQMARANNERVNVTIRVNGVRGTREELKQKLESEGITCEYGNLSQDALLILKGNVIKTKAFEQGWFYVQDESSMLVARALKPKHHSKVLDTCSAPGGKTTHVAELMRQTGTVYAHDVYEHKIKLIKDNVKRLGLTNVVATLQDATTLNERYESDSFDAVLVDAPCSGLGILRRHPEVKITKQPSDLDEIMMIQKKILNTVAPLVKVGGTLVYSTCTVNRKENDKMVEQFLAQHPEYELDPTLVNRLPEVLHEQTKNGMVQLFPGDYQTDGFFIACLKRQA
ncbi:16S rRNA (cytosine(967)-C(5))-methyltransferase RsmB [Turicibacter bilis]|uniref:16S rRNA (cytosine(967)-C(5))-methyltransferase n=1 Tax=Turicibacter bilis TaxID=2735723 RepID=A0A9Q9CG96_9FIRM|nr:16S rRNA (cytosine(967)-C(5))-methyltransferase RsmB [Turicibacter bilis]MBS3197894.1 16S rRNA (cytosine(967)-C(5))-methyltransferase RsmB [Turicibacter bilis]MBS3199924.1 16S rRNA (cytosine(967)-C(5))-methyltransferase RsmB [Turicibacter bilis]UUF06790.1 16S rRNA (cytosine(967)-C(5))-methyltransferase RsmB [Turicibacter bilis]UUF08015.1 16S rRNA (cytosine(967)-C(5))-methyltransferase RsmB [Turicibacter bilis]